MERMLFACILIIGSCSTYEGDVASLCPGTIPLSTVPASGVATWWVSSSTGINLGACGITNNQSPCRCTGIKTTSDIEPSYIPNYNTTSFGYNYEKDAYENAPGTLNLIDCCQKWAIFNYTDYSTQSSMVMSALDTDNHEHFVILYACGVTTEAGNPIVIILLKSPKWTVDSLPLKTQERIYKVLRNNNLLVNDLQTFDNSQCPELDTCI